MNSQHYLNEDRTGLLTAIQLLCMSSCLFLVSVYLIFRDHINHNQTYACILSALQDLWQYCYYLLRYYLSRYYLSRYYLSRYYLLRYYLSRYYLSRYYLLRYYLLRYYQWCCSYTYLWLCLRSSHNKPHHYRPLSDVEFNHHNQQYDINLDTLEEYFYPESGSHTPSMTYLHTHDDHAPTGNPNISLLSVASINTESSEYFSDTSSTISIVSDTVTEALPTASLISNSRSVNTNDSILLDITINDSQISDSMSSTPAPFCADVIMSHPMIHAWAAPTHADIFDGGQYVSPVVSTYSFANNYSMSFNYNQKY